MAWCRDRDTVGMVIAKLKLATLGINTLGIGIDLQAFLRHLSIFEEV